MKAMLVCLLMMAGAAQAADPVAVTLVSSNTTVPCNSTWYQDRFKTWRMFRFDPLACWNGLKADTGQYHMFAAQDFSDQAIVAVSFDVPVTSVTVKQVYGRSDYANRQADVEVSFDFGVTWIASSRDEWSAPDYLYKPFYVCPTWSYACYQRATKSWTATAPYPITVVWVKGKKYSPVAGRTWLPDIAVVTGN